MRSLARAKVFWDPLQCPSVLPLTLSHQEYAALLTRTGVMPSLVITSPTGRHLLFHDEDRHLQVFAQLEPALGKSGIMTDAILSTSAFMPRLRSLACFNDLLCGGRLLGQYFLLEPRQRRLTDVLRALDGVLAGASHRDIATAAWGRKRVDADWGDPREHLRDTVRRAIGRGRALMRSGYLNFLK